MVTTDSITPDPAVETMLRGATQSVAGLVARPIATLAEDMPRRGDQYALGNLIADAQRIETHSDVAVMNNGGIRSDLRAGPLSYGTLFELQPFGNLLVQVTVRGKDLRAYIESFVAHGAPRVHVSGIVAHYDLTRPVGSRIVSVTVGGAPLDDARQYTVAYTDFMATGGDGLGLASAATEAGDARHRRSRRAHRIRALAAGRNHQARRRAAPHSGITMTEPEAIRVFVNGTAQSVTRGATILDAIRAFDPAEAVKSPLERAPRRTAADCPSRTTPRVRRNGPARRVGARAAERRGG